MFEVNWGHNMQRLFWDTTYCTDVISGRNFLKLQGVSQLGNARTKHNQLPAISRNFYDDAKKLFQADDCIMITSN